MLHQLRTGLLIMPGLLRQEMQYGFGINTSIRVCLKSFYSLLIFHCLPHQISLPLF